MAEDKTLSLEEKVDEILKQQKSMRRWIVARGVVSLVLFTIFIVLPVLASLYLFEFLRATVDLEKLSGGFSLLDQINQVGLTEIFGQMSP